MTTASPLYGSTVSVTFTLTGLASDTGLITGRQSGVADNTTDDAIDALVFLSFATGSGPTASRQAELWLAGSADGTNHSAGLGAGDSAASPQGEKTLLKLLTIIPTDGTSSHVYEVGPFSVAQAFGGVMPVEWCAFFVHNSGVNLSATASYFYLRYRPVQYESA